MRLSKAARLAWTPGNKQGSTFPPSCFVHVNLPHLFSFFVVGAKWIVCTLHWSPPPPFPSGGLISPPSLARTHKQRISGEQTNWYTISRAFYLQWYYTATATLFITARKLFIKVRKQKLFFSFFFLNISKIKLFIYLFFKQDTTTDPQNAKTCFVAVRAPGTEGQLISGPSRARPRKNTMNNLKQTLLATSRGDECKKKNAPTEHENEKNPFQWWLHYTAVLSASLSARFRLLSVFCFCPTTLTDFLPLGVAITESALPFQRFNTLQNNLNRCLLRATRAFRPRPCLISHSVDLIFLT